jgi:hypothetical protein
MALDPVRRVWTIRGERRNILAACKDAAALRQSGLIARVKYIERPDPLPVKPAVNNATRKWRDDQAGKVIELADARKRYKSPG